jgi:hypothetical protein
VEDVDAGFLERGVVGGGKVFRIAQHFHHPAGTDPKRGEHVDDCRSLDQIDGVGGIGLIGACKEAVVIAIEKSGAVQQSCAGPSTAERWG